MSSNKTRWALFKVNLADFEHFCQNNSKWFSKIWNGLPNGFFILFLYNLFFYILNLVYNWRGGLWDMAFLWAKGDFNDLRLLKSWDCGSGYHYKDKNLIAGKKNPFFFITKRFETIFVNS